jgi:hypothetical protein
MKFIKKLIEKSTKRGRFMPTKTSNQQEVLRATETALSKYSKTFKDLASYDRGEKKYSVSR